MEILLLDKIEQETLNIARRFLTLHDKAISSRTLRAKFENHPDFPSLAAISDTLGQVGLKNMPVRIPQDKLPGIPLPAIAYTSCNEGEFVILHAINKGRIDLEYANGIKERILENEFFEVWDGTLLISEPSPTTQEPEKIFSYLPQLTNINPDRISVAVVILLLLFTSLSVYTLLYRNEVIGLCIFLLKIIGIIISVLLLRHSYFPKQSIIEKLCSSEEKSCDDVLNSSMAQIFSFISLSELGFLYFMFGYLSIFLSTISDHGDIFPLLGLISGLSIPLIIASLYYQFFIVKVICPLCMAIQAILAGEILLSIRILGSVSLENINFQEPLLGFAMAVCILIISKRISNLIVLADKLKRDLVKTKFNPAYLHSLSIDSQKMPELTDEMKSTYIGNVNGSQTITLVTNPFCQPCKVAHGRIAELASQYSHIKCNIIFLATNQMGDARGTIARRLLSLDKEQFEFALHGWFSDSKATINKWSSDFQANNESIESFNLLETHYTWCETANISYTPTIYVNGRELPKNYSIEEIPYLARL